MRKTQKSGWIKVWRKIVDDPMWTSEPFTKGQAWIDLLLLAQATDNESVSGGKVTKFSAGTVYFSILDLSKRWKWSRGKVKRFLEQLQNDTTVRFVSDTTNGTAVTIENWALYQSGGQRNGHQTDSKTDKKRTTGGHNVRIYKNNKKNKEGGSFASPEMGERPPAIGEDGTEYIEVDGMLHRFPASWYGFAEKNEMSIEDYVRKRHR